MVNGIVKEENDKVVTVQTQNDVVRLNKSDIDSRKQSMQSMMPDGQLTMMSDAEVRDLIAYLAGAGPGAAAGSRDRCRAGSSCSLPPRGGGSG